MKRDRKVHFSELVFTKRISKDSEWYLKNKRNTIENCVINVLFDYGKSLSVGQEIRYIVTDFYNKNYVKRSLPVELVEDLNRDYDVPTFKPTERIRIKVEDMCSKSYYDILIAF